MDKTSMAAFVGVCGMQSADEYEWLADLVGKILYGTDYFLMAGIKRVDSEHMVPAIQSDKVKALVHCDFQADVPFEQKLRHVISRSQRFVYGLQLNVLPWMEVDYRPLWCAIKQAHPNVLLVLQAHRALMDRYTPEQVAARLHNMPVDYIMFDPSQSRGEAYDLPTMRAYVKAIYDAALPQGVVVAGGLSGDSLESLFASLKREFAGLSCDAFGQLQDPEAARLSWPKVNAYLRALRNC